MANLDNIRGTVALIEEDFAQYNGVHFDMHAWVAPPEDDDDDTRNTSMCFAGWSLVHKVGSMSAFLAKAVYLAGEDIGDPEWATTSFVADIEDQAQEWLELDNLEARAIFYHTTMTTVEELKTRITDVLEVTIWPDYPYQEEDHPEEGDE